MEKQKSLKSVDKVVKSICALSAAVVSEINSHCPPPFKKEKSTLFKVPASETNNSSVSAGVAPKAV